MTLSRRDFVVAAAAAAASRSRAMTTAGHMAMLSGGPSLPYDRAVAYLQSSGTQYINSGLALNSILFFNVRGAFSGSGESYMVGGRQSSNSRRLAIMRTGESNARFGFLRGTSNYYHSNADASVHDFALRSDGWYLDGSNIRSFTVSSAQNSTSPFLLFTSSSDAAGTPLTNGLNGRIYSCQIHDSNNTLLRDFIPVRIGQVGYMYDRANPTGGPLGNGLYPNDGTGAFAVGPDV